MSGSARLARTEIVLKLLCFQGAMTGLVVVLAVFYSREAAVSAFLGGGCVILYTCLFAALVFYYRGAQFARKILAAFYVGELVKIVFTAAFFWLVFAKYEGLRPLWLLSSFLVCQASAWLVLLKA